MRRYRYRIVDDESGLTFKDDRAATRWDGAIVRDRNIEYDHPQKYIRAKDDPTPNPIIRPEHWPESGVKLSSHVDKFNPSLEYFIDYTNGNLQPDPIVGVSADVRLFTESSVKQNTRLEPAYGAATHLYLAGIGHMVVGSKSDFLKFAVHDKGKTNR